MCTSHESPVGKATRTELHLDVYVLQVNTVAPVLYASQWFLTLFACPFPSAFSARVIDIILTEGHSEILLQACLPALSIPSTSCDERCLMHSYEGKMAMY